MQTINPVLQGLLQGVSVGNMIRQSALQQEAAEREKMRFQHERQVNDLQTRMMLAKSTRPVLAGGMVQENVTADLPELDPENPGTPRMRKQRTTVVRPVDKTRRVQWKSPISGDVIEGELLSQDDQVEQELQRLRLMGEVQNSNVLDQIRGRESILAPIRKLEREQAHTQRKELATDAQRWREEEAQRNRDFQTKRDKANKKFQLKLAKTREDAATLRNRDDNAQADKRILAAETRANEADRKRLKTEHDTLDRQTAGLWGAYQRIADAWDKSKAVMTIGEGGRVVPVKSKGGKEVTGDSPENQAQVEAIRRQIKAQLEPLERRKQEIMGTLNPGRSAAADKDAWNRFRVTLK